MIGHFHIPGDATRREYAVYVLVARERPSGNISMYVGKTGDNREGCNPVISRAGNHFSFNKVHSQMRNHLGMAKPEDFDFDYFYATFGCYTHPEQDRTGVDVINEMERQLNLMVQEVFPDLKLLNPYEGRTPLRKWQRDEREAIVTEQRRGVLSELIQQVRSFLGASSK